MASQSYDSSETDLDGFGLDEFDLSESDLARFGLAGSTLADFGLSGSNSTGSDLDEKEGDVSDIVPNLYNSKYLKKNTRYQNVEILKGQIF